MGEGEGRGLELEQEAQVEERLQALLELAHAPDPGLMGTALSALADENWRVRKAGVDALVALGPSEEVLSALVARLADSENAGLRNAASEALVGLGDAAVPAVKRALRSDDADVRLFCCQILGQIGDPSALDSLEAVVGDSDENVRTAAIENLGRFKLPEASEALIGFLDSQDLSTRFAALEALATQGARVPVEKIRRLLSQAILRKAVFDVLSTDAYPEALEEMVMGLLDTARSSREAALRAFCNTVLSKPEELRERAIELVRSRLDQAALKRIAQALESEDQAVRRAAVRVLGASGRPEVLDLLLPLGSDEGVYQALREALAMLGEEAARVLLERFDSLERNAQAVAAMALGKIGYRPALPLLHRCLRSDFGHLLRAAAEAVGALGDPQSIADLVALLAHPYPDVRDAAMRALGSIGTDHPQEVLPLLDKPLASTDPTVRAATIAVIGDVADDEQGIQQLVLALGDVDAKVRAAAAKALAAAQFAEAGSALSRAMADEDPLVRRTVAFALGAYADAECLEGLRIALRDPDLWVRCEAVRSLGRLALPESLEILEQTLQEKTLHPVVASRTLEALEEADSARALRQAVGLLENQESDVLLSALAVLARVPLGKEQLAVEQIRALLQHNHWNVRAHAAAVLGRVRAGEAQAALEERLGVERDSLVQRALRDAMTATGGG